MAIEVASNVVFKPVSITLTIYSREEVLKLIGDLQEVVNEYGTGCTLGKLADDLLKAL